jgi:hypothetical protein
MSQENLDLVRRTYAQWALGNMKAGVELFHPQIVFESFMPDASERVVVQGPEAVEAFMRGSSPNGATGLSERTFDRFGVIRSSSPATNRRWAGRAESPLRIP